MLKTRRKLIESGLIGDIITFKTNFAHSGPETWSIEAGTECLVSDKEKAVMGAMADLGIHKADLISNTLTGSRVAEVIGYLGTLDKRDASGSLIGVDDNAICIYRWKTDASEP